MFGFEWYLIHNIAVGNWEPFRALVLFGFPITTLLHSSYGPFATKEEAEMESLRIGKINSSELFSYLKNK